MTATRSAFVEGWRVGKVGGSGPLLPVTLPHTWNAEDGVTNTYDRSPWRYEKTFQAEPAWKGRWLFLEFEAANSVATVRLNGRTLATHRGGFSTFRVPITEALDFSGLNRLEVVVDNSPVEEVYPLMADFTFFGGLYRPVWLIVTGEVHFDLLDSGSGGVYLSQTDVGAEKAVVECELAVVVEAGPREVTCQVRVLDAHGVLVTEVEEKATLWAASRFLRGLVLPRPHLWQGVKNPYLYRVEVDLWVDGVVADTRTIALGVRSYAVDPERGFLLNGVPTPLRGVSRHQDRADRGWALTEADQQEDLALLLELGANTVRLSHYQHSVTFLDLCDRAGLVVWAEVPVISRLSKTDPTGENAVTQLTELIRQQYNHTSICFWGVQNEITIANSSPALERLVARLHRLAKSLDPWRLTTQAQVGHLPEDDALNSLTDVLAYNKYYGWYYGDALDFDGWLTEFHARQPLRALGLSEYGAEGLLAYHSDAPRMGDYTEEYHALYHETVYGVIEKHPWLWGTYVWNMFDFASAIRDEGGVKGRNNKGLVTHDRKLRKDAFYFYQACWSDRQVLHLNSQRWKERTTATIAIKAYSNRPEVTLTVNGRQVVGTARGVVWTFPDVALAPGANTVTLRCGGFEESVVWNRVEVATVNYTCPAPGGSFVTNWFSAGLATGGEVLPLVYPEGVYSIKDPIEAIIEVTEGEAVLRRYLAPLFASPMFAMVKSMSLEMLASMDRKTLTPAVLGRMNADLNAVRKT
ncbi:MAG: glycoside hydrolase family 2 TIM barrel-domain containing protein [Spirochaetales bacterium]